MYAVSIFVSFLARLLAMVRFSHRAGKTILTARNVAGVVVVAFTLVVNLARGYPLVAIGVTVVVAALLHWRSEQAAARGIQAIEREAEVEDLACRARQRLHGLCMRPDDLEPASLVGVS